MSLPLRSRLLRGFLTIALATSTACTMEGPESDGSDQDTGTKQPRDSGSDEFDAGVVTDAGRDSAQAPDVSGTADSAAGEMGDDDPWIEVDRALDQEIKCDDLCAADGLICPNTWGEHFFFENIGGLAMYSQDGEVGFGCDELPPQTLLLQNDEEEVLVKVTCFCQSPGE